MDRLVLLTHCSTLPNFVRYSTTIVDGDIVRPKETPLIFRTERKVPKLGVMLIGIGGNNGWCVVPLVLL
jgi:hypothetical protein